MAPTPVQKSGDRILYTLLDGEVNGKYMRNCSELTLKIIHSVLLRIQINEFTVCFLLYNNI